MEGNARGEQPSLMLTTEETQPPSISIVGCLAHESLSRELKCACKRNPAEDRSHNSPNKAGGINLTLEISQLRRFTGQKATRLQAAERACGFYRVPAHPNSVPFNSPNFHLPSWGSVVKALGFLPSSGPFLAHISTSNFGRVTTSPTHHSEFPPSFVTATPSPSPLNQET